MYNLPFQTPRTQYGWWLVGGQNCLVAPTPSDQTTPQCWCCGTEPTTGLRSTREYRYILSVRAEVGSDVTDDMHIKKKLKYDQDKMISVYQIILKCEQINKHLSCMSHHVLLMHIIALFFNRLIT